MSDRPLLHGQCRQSKDRSDSDFGTTGIVFLNSKTGWPPLHARAGKDVAISRRYGKIMLALGFTGRTFTDDEARDVRDALSALLDSEPSVTLLGTSEDPS